MPVNVILEAKGDRGSGKTTILGICAEALQADDLWKRKRLSYSTLEHRDLHQLMVTRREEPPEPLRGFLMECLNCGAELSILLRPGTDTSHLGNVCLVCGCATLTERR